jgi:hypothetical protein
MHHRGYPLSCNDLRCNAQAGSNLEESYDGITRYNRYILPKLTGARGLHKTLNIKKLQLQISPIRCLSNRNDHCNKYPCPA